jgi:putative sterol carrier protein
VDVGADLSGQVLRVGVRPGETADRLATAAAQLAPEDFERHRVSVGFDVGDRGTYRILLDDGRATLDAHCGESDCVIRTDEATLLEVLRGERSFATALMSDRIGVQGDRLVATLFFTRVAAGPAG